MDVLFKDSNIFYNVLCFLITENEKFFDRNDAKLYWKTVFHVIALSHHVYIALFAMGLDLDGSTEIEIRTLKRFRAGYLTGWSFLFQSTFLSLAVIHDLLEWFDKHTEPFGIIVRYWRDVIFSGLVTPITLFVTTMFWSVYWVDRELVFPTVYDDIVPWWFNHCVHTNIVVVVIVEILLEPRRKPRDLKLETIMYMTASILYAVVYYSIYFFAGRWLYKVFGIMTWWQVCLYQLLIWGSTHVFYKMQFPIGRLIHGNETWNADVEDKTENKDMRGQFEEINGAYKITEKENTKEEIVDEEKATEAGFEGRVKYDDLINQIQSKECIDRNLDLKYREVSDKIENLKL